MEEALGKRVIGQAAGGDGGSPRRCAARGRDCRTPAVRSARFLFLGPTGVGKTELTKALAAFLFDDDAAMVRIDMSEFMEKHAVSRLIGAPPGYVGYDEGGVLTEAVRRRPYQVVLFDEVEKAHPDVFNVLLQVLDDGRLTDGQGRVVDFSNTLIILTSNLGSQYPVESGGRAAGQRSRGPGDGNGARPFPPRIPQPAGRDRAVPPAGAWNTWPRSWKFRSGRVQKLLKDRKIVLELTDGAKAWLGRVGYDPVYGARPLKRAVQRYLQDPLAEKLLAGEVPDGSTVKIDEGDGALQMLVV